MNINQISQSRFLKKEDFPKPVLVTIEADVYIDTIPGFDGEPDKEKAVVKFVEYEKPMTLNTTNAQLIAMALGSDETEEWIGKQIVVYNDPTVAMKGKLVGGLRVRASKAPQQLPRPVPGQAVTGKLRPGAAPQTAQPAAGPIDEEDMPF
jgi:hypothetical protein